MPTIPRVLGFPYSRVIVIVVFPHLWLSFFLYMLIFWLRVIDSVSGVSDR